VVLRLSMSAWAFAAPASRRKGPAETAGRPAGFEMHPQPGWDWRLGQGETGLTVGPASEVIA
jgi:hypothetical protein